MTWRVRVRPEAELDLLVAAGWYEAQRSGLGAEFIEELSRLFASLAENALLYAERFEGVRAAPGNGRHTSPGNDSMGSGSNGLGRRIPLSGRFRPSRRISVSWA